MFYFAAYKLTKYEATEEPAMWHLSKVQAWIVGISLLTTLYSLCLTDLAIIVELMNYWTIAQQC
jgi:hypothetical protein